MRLTFSAMALAAALAAAVSGAGPAWATDPVVVSGAVTWISAEAVEVSGRRAILGAGSDIRSDDRTVSWSSIRVGMPASMEVDGAGRVLELRVNGVVE